MKAKADETGKPRVVKAFRLNEDIILNFINACDRKKVAPTETIEKLMKKFSKL